MSAPPPGSRRLWPWLLPVSLALVVAYPVTWHIDVYFYAIAVLGGGTAYFALWAGLILTRVARRQSPILDLPAAILLGAMMLVQFAALAWMQTIRWA